MQIENYHKFKILNSKRIQIEKQIGSGSFGIICKGKYNSTYIARKEMKNYDEPKFLKEILLTHYLRNIKSPALLGLERVYHKNSLLNNSNQQLNHGIKTEYSMIMELITGETLSNQISKQTKESIKLPQNELLFILYAIDLAKGIEFLSKRKIIHRDLKPDNIMISNNFDVRIIDFGIAKEQKHTITQTRESGTLLYFPPENLRNPYVSDSQFLESDTSESSNVRYITTAFDIWCYGLIISEMFGCETPWGKSKNILVNLMTKKKFPIPSSIENEIIILIIENCTRFYPSERITIDNIIKILVTLLKERLIHHSVNNDLANIF